MHSRRGRQPGGQESPGAVQVVAAVRRQGERAGRALACPDRLGEALGVAADEPHRTLDDWARAAVVRHEVDPAQPRERAGQVEHPPHVGQPPGIDRLNDHRVTTGLGRASARSPHINSTERSCTADQLRSSIVLARAGASQPAPASVSRHARDGVSTCTATEMSECLQHYSARSWRSA